METNPPTKRSTSGRVLCPCCGAEMNFHAEKVDYAAAMEDPGAADPALGGVVEQFHTCPCCKTVVERAAEEP